MNMFKKIKENMKGKPRTSFPDDIIELSNILSSGQMVPVRTDIALNGNKEPFLSFLVKTDDDVIKITESNPFINFSYGCLTFNDKKKIFVLYFLLRVNNKEDLTYEMAFSLADESMHQDCKVFAKQRGLQILFSGDTSNSVVTAKLDSLLHHNIEAVISTAEKNTNLDWSRDEFMDCIGFVNDNTTGPTQLWSLLQDNDGFLEVNRP